ncbi:MAG: tetratricopeptide repeat protein [Bacteroidales bacterium]
MSRINFFIVVFSLFSSVAFSQDTINFNIIDQKTYGFANYGEWDSVIHYGKLGLANNIDYFYLRLRLGEAYYYKQNYATSIKHFEKALKSNSGDTNIQKFLYYSYLFSGKENDARYLGAMMTDGTKKDVHFKKDISLKDVYFETGRAYSNNITQNGNIKMEGSENIGGNADLTNNISYVHLGLDINIGKWLTIYPGVSYIIDEKQRIFESNASITETQLKAGGRSVTSDTQTVVHPPKNGHPPFTSHDTIYNIQEILQSADTNLNIKYNFRNKYNLKQAEFYLKCNVHVATGLDIVPFFHLLSIRSTIYNVNANISNHSANVFLYDSNIRHTQVPLPPSSAKDTIVYKDTSFQTAVDRYQSHSGLSEKDTSYYNYSLGLSINKNWGRVSTILFASYSNLNNKKQKEEGFTLIWYPEGNLNLYFSSTLTAFEQDTMKKIVFNQLAGIKINKYIWLEGFVTLGNFSDFTENNGFVVNNNPDLVKFRCGISPIFVFKRFDISLTYLFVAKQGNYVTDLPQNAYTTNPTKYINNVIIAGIKWKL